MQKSGSGKIQNIQALRGIAVLLVVCFHLTTIERKYGGTTTILPDFFQFGMFGVDLFFVISGFVMVTITRGKFQQPRKALVFLYHRISRIYPLYWFYSLLVLAVFLYQPSLVNSFQNSQVDLTASFLLLPQSLRPLLMVGWTLVHEMYFYLVFFLLLFLPERFLVPALCTWAVALLIFFPEASVSGSPWQLVAANPLTMEFIGGCFIALLTGNRHDLRRSPRMALICVAGLFIGSVLLFMYHWHTTGLVEPPDWKRILILGLPALLIIYLMVKAEQQNIVLPVSLQKIGDASYSIYLSHILTLNLLGRIWQHFTMDSTIDNRLVLPFLFSAVVGAGIMSYIFIERPMIRASRKIA